MNVIKLNTMFVNALRCSSRVLVRHNVLTRSLSNKPYVLSAEDRATGLQAIPSWVQVDGARDAITKDFEFDSFVEAWVNFSECC